MEDYELCNVDHEDISDALSEIEESFKFKYGKNDLAEVKTFGEFYDITISKIQLTPSDGCTTQQAFYRLRNVFSEQFPEKKIIPKILLSELLPDKKRRLVVDNIQNKINLQLNILHPPEWILILLALVFTGSLIILFIFPFIGGCGLVFSILGIRAANIYGNILSDKTVGQLVTQLTCENYALVRQNPNTCNKSEIEKLLINMFSYKFDLDKSKLTRDAHFFNNCDSSHEKSSEKSNLNNIVF